MAVKEIEFTLEEPIKVDVAGEKKECYTVILKAPSNKVRRQCDKLGSKFALALRNLTQAEGTAPSTEPEKKATFTAKEIIAFLTMYCDDYVGFCDDFESLATAGIAEVEGVKLNSLLFGGLSYEDAQNMMGVYLENFIVGSLMKRLQSA